MECPGKCIYVFSLGNRCFSQAVVCEGDFFLIFMTRMFLLSHWGAQLSFQTLERTAIAGCSQWPKHRWRQVWCQWRMGFCCSALPPRTLFGGKPCWGAQLQWIPSPWGWAGSSTPAEFSLPAPQIQQRLGSWNCTGTVLPFNPHFQAVLHMWRWWERLRVSQTFLELFLQGKDSKSER